MHKFRTSTFLPIILFILFVSRYVHSDLKHGDFIRQAGEDPGLREVYQDDQAVTFEVVRETVLQE